MAWGYGTTVEDTEVYEGPSDDAEDNLNELNKLNEFVSASSSQPLNKQRVSDKFSFYLDDDKFGVRFSDSPFSANINVGQGGQTNWGAQLGGGTGLLNANVGIAGQGTSGQISPWGDFSVSPLPGLTFSAGAQKNPGMNFNLWGPSINYQNELKTPWGPLNYNIGREDGRTIANLQMRGDF